MGDTHYDPTDRHRTTHSRAGLTMKDNFLWPGFILLGVALSGIVATVAVAAYHHYEWLTATAPIALLATVAASLWFIVELRRVTLLEGAPRARVRLLDTVDRQAGS